MPSIRLAPSPPAPGLQSHQHYQALAVDPLDPSYSLSSLLLSRAASHRPYASPAPATPAPISSFDSTSTQPTSILAPPVSPMTVTAEGGNSSEGGHSGRRSSSGETVGSRRGTLEGGDRRGSWGAGAMIVEAARREVGQPVGLGLEGWQLRGDGQDGSPLSPNPSPVGTKEVAMAKLRRMSLTTTESESFYSWPEGPESPVVPGLGRMKSFLGPKVTRHGVAPWGNDEDAAADFRASSSLAPSPAPSLFIRTASSTCTGSGGFSERKLAGKKCLGRLVVPPASSSTSSPIQASPGGSLARSTLLMVSALDSLPVTHGPMPSTPHAGAPLQLTLARGGASLQGFPARPSIGKSSFDLFEDPYAHRGAASVALKEPGAASSMSSEKMSRPPTPGMPANSTMRTASSMSGADAGVSEAIVRRPSASNASGRLAKLNRTGGEAVPALSVYGAEGCLGKPAKTSFGHHHQYHVQGMPRSPSIGSSIASGFTSTTSVTAAASAATATSTTTTTDTSSWAPYLSVSSNGAVPPPSQGLHLISLQAAREKERDRGEQQREQSGVGAVSVTMSTSCRADYLDALAATTSLHSSVGTSGGAVRGQGGQRPGQKVKLKKSGFLRSLKKVVGSGRGICPEEPMPGAKVGTGGKTLVSGPVGGVVVRNGGADPLPPTQALKSMDRTRSRSSNDKSFVPLLTQLHCAPTMALNALPDPQTLPTQGKANPNAAISLLCAPQSEGELRTQRGMGGAGGDRPSLNLRPVSMAFSAGFSADLMATQEADEEEEEKDPGFAASMAPSPTASGWQGSHSSQGSDPNIASYAASSLATPLTPATTIASSPRMYLPHETSAPIPGSAPALQMQFSSYHGRAGGELSAEEMAQAKRVWRVQIWELEKQAKLVREEVEALRAEKEKLGGRAGSGNMEATKMSPLCGQPCDTCGCTGACMITKASVLNQIHINASAGGGQRFGSGGDYN